ncbi:hypothetical protein JVT61DRAFT_11985 [Boletus reticuloceps]|uniref:Uncharacterized protein n=1 Tax=Boletus reticuloceps TaxID=495285 RepID=A0A8I2YEN0_9AGAM|nr:hypothetical protein JVT61DRAFT_11985 [Boletus reticuloceps]
MSTIQRLQAQMKARLAAPTPSSSFAIDPSLVSGSVVSSGRAGASTSVPRAPTPDTSTPESRGINVTPPRREVTPLTELEEDMLPLTPITNKKGKQTKAVKGKGKRPANQGDDVASASRPKRSKRSRA